MDPKAIERFQRYVDSGGPVPPHAPELGPCWVWTGGKFPFGHGSFWLDGKNLKASRVAFFLEHGRWPEPCALHHCDNPSCVRPSHLFEGTTAENNADAARKGRSRGGAPCGLGNANTKLDERSVVAIRTAFGAGESKASLSRRFGVNHSTIRQIVSRTTWRHVP